MRRYIFHGWQAASSKDSNTEIWHKDRLPDPVANLLLPTLCLHVCKGPHLPALVLAVLQINVKTAVFSCMTQHLGFVVPQNGGSCIRARHVLVAIHKRGDVSLQRSLRPSEDVRCSVNLRWSVQSSLAPMGTCIVHASVLVRNHHESIPHRLYYKVMDQHRDIVAAIRLA